MAAHKTRQIKYTKTYKDKNGQKWAIKWEIGRHTIKIYSTNMRLKPTKRILKETEKNTARDWLRPKSITPVSP